MIFYVNVTHGETNVIKARPEVIMPVIMTKTLSWNVTLPDTDNVTNVSEKLTASIFREVRYPEDGGNIFL